MDNNGEFDYQGRAEACRKAQLDFKNHLNFFTEDFLTSPNRKAMPTWVEYQRNPTYQGLLDRFWKSLAAAYPLDFWDDYKKLQGRDDPKALESAIAFLEADPYFFRSGYVKEKLLHYIKGYSLTEQQISRLQRVILNVTDRHYCCEFRQYCRLARKLNDEVFYAELKTRLQHIDPNVQKRAQWVLDALTPPINEPNK